MRFLLAHTGVGCLVYAFVGSYWCWLPHAFLLLKHSPFGVWFARLTLWLHTDVGCLIIRFCWLILVLVALYATLLAHVLVFLVYVFVEILVLVASYTLLTLTGVGCPHYTLLLAHTGVGCLVYAFVCSTSDLVPHYTLWYYTGVGLPHYTLLLAYTGWLLVYAFVWLILVLVLPRIRFFLAHTGVGCVACVVVPVLVASYIRFCYHTGVGGLLYTLLLAHTGVGCLVYAFVIILVLVASYTLLLAHTGVGCLVYLLLKAHAGVVGCLVYAFCLLMLVLVALIMLLLAAHARLLDFASATTLLLSSYYWCWLPRTCAFVGSY
jgi:hypothetical protein